MLKTILRYSIVSVLVLAGCTFPGAITPTVDTDAIRTAIAQTVQAARTLTAEPGIPVTGDETPSPTVTTAPTPTALILPTTTPFPTFTAVPTTPQVSVSVPTNCRVGPGRAYTRIGALLVGEVAQVVGRNPGGDYWIINNPDGNGTCWLWGEYATVTGVTSGLPVWTAPPLPTPEPGFDVFNEGLERCEDTGWWLDINVENIGELTFDSIAIVVEDRDDDTTVSLYSDGFTDNDGCDESDSWDELPAGTDRTVSSPVFTYNPTGNRLRATITLCSNERQSGTCVTHIINFTP